MFPEITDKTVTWTGNFLQSISLEYCTSAGKRATWEAYERVGCSGAVAIVPFTGEGEVIVVKQFRPPVNKYVIEFPAGLNDRNESLEEVANRELLEETGYRVGSLSFVCQGPLSAGTSSELLTVFRADDSMFCGNQRLDYLEEIEVLTLSVNGFLASLQNMSDDSTWIDMKVPGLFELARLR